MNPLNHALSSSVVNTMSASAAMGVSDKKMLWFALGLATVTICINIYLHHQLKKEQQWRKINTTI
jgi:hypothetical protein